MCVQQWTLVQSEKEYGRWLTYTLLLALPFPAKVVLVRPDIAYSLCQCGLLGPSVVSRGLCQLMT
jgi:hypothetical protein